MNPETEKTLATLEVILEQPIRFHLPCHEDSADFQPYIWDTSKQGEFTPLNLIKYEGWIKKTDAEVALDSWIQIEQNGLASDLIHVYDKDPENLLLNDNSKAIRYKYYCDLLDVLIDEIQELQAFNLTYNSHYSLFIISGMIPDTKNWICLSAKVPQETPEYIEELIDGLPYIQDKKINPENKQVSQSEIKINNILKKLDTIPIYGYYNGGYCHTHPFGVVCSLGNSKEDVINKALTASGLVEIYKCKLFNISDELESFYEYNEIEEVKKRCNLLQNFLLKNFSELFLYRFCFWDYEHIYIIGEKGDRPLDATFSDRDRVGISLHSQFTYNP